MPKHCRRPIEPVSPLPRGSHCTLRLTSRTVQHPTPFVSSLTLAFASSMGRTSKVPFGFPLSSIASYTAFIFVLLDSFGSTAIMWKEIFRVETISSKLIAAHTPTGPRPTIAAVNVISSSKMLRLSVPGLKQRGHGFPVNTGCTFGWLIACIAAKRPVGSMSASMSSELSESLSRAVCLCSGDMLDDQVEGSLRSNSVPPAFGTRTYWAWPPSRRGDPKSTLSRHRAVYPRRQTLKSR